MNITPIFYNIFRSILFVSIPFVSILFFRSAPLLSQDRSFDSFITGKDIIVFQNQQGHSQRLQGTVLNITGTEGLIFLPLNQTKPVFIVPDNILRLETILTESHRQGEAAFQEARKTGNSELWSKAHQNFLQARSTDEKRPWVRFWLTALLVQTNIAMKKPINATQEFLLLCQVDPHPPWLSFIPLFWDTDSTLCSGSDVLTLEQIILPWLESENNPSGKPNDAARLLAASILLDGSPNWQKKAVQTLEELIVIRNPDPQSNVLNKYYETISLLALAQLERKKCTMPLTEINAEALIETIKRLPSPLKAGPYYLMGFYYEKNQKNEEALEYYLRLPILYPENSFLTDSALTHATTLLKKMGRSAETTKLLNRNTSH